MPRKRRRASQVDDGGSVEKAARMECDATTALQLDFRSPKSLLESLLAPTTLDEFFSAHWEKSPLLVRHVGGVERLFSRHVFEDIVTNHELHFARDVNVMRTADGQRVCLNGKGRFTIKKLQQLYGEKNRGTVQFHQPQRFHDELWRILEALESFFGANVGANVYMTPAKAQGLPPHYDDVEVFIVQLEGEKHWKLYKPLVQLPRDYSSSLSESVIGRPMMTFTLKPGDVLYFPRGTVHHAKTGDVPSTHITISTYQRESWVDYLMSIVPSLLVEATAADIDFRRGLPINFVQSLTMSGGQTTRWRTLINKLSDRLKGFDVLPSPESMVEAFVRNRLPPFQVNADELVDDVLPEGSMPDSTSSLVRLKFADHISYLVKHDDLGKSLNVDDSESDDDDDDEVSSDAVENGDSTSDRKMLFVYSSLLNDRQSHMMGLDLLTGDDAQSNKVLCLKLQPHLLEAMSVLKRNSDRFVPIADLPCPVREDVQDAVKVLWASHLLEVQP